MTPLLRFCTRALLLTLLLFLGLATALAQTRTYTLDADFDEGTLVNVNHDAPNNDQLQLDSQAMPFGFIWVAASTKGTIVKIDTQTGAVLGEFRTHPTLTGSGANPSRTTVDNDGSVWVANRGGNPGTVTHVGLVENNQCEDRNNNGVIDTSTGLGDVKGWTPGGPRGVGNAADECIVHHTAINATGGTRHISVDANNDVWVSSTNNRNFDLIKGGKYDVPLSGTIIRSETSVGYGGYGGLIDGNGVIWSARPLLRWDTANPLIGPNGDPVGFDIGPPLAGTNWSGQSSPDSYGLCIDSQGNVWNTQLSGNLIHKYAPNGLHLGAFAHGAGNGWAQGCVVDGNDHVWTAHSLDFNRNTIGHLLNDGTFVGNVVLSDLDVGPTGVAVDGNGKIWATGYRSQRVYRIDPTAGPIGGGGVPIGAEDFRSVDLGGQLYNYSDMTGSTLIAPPNSGTWMVIYDSGIPGVEWGFVTWSPLEPGDSDISVTAASSPDGVTFGPPENVTQGVDLTVADGQYLKVSVNFTRATTGESPVLYDLTITANRPPDCTNAFADPDELWPPNHKMRDVNVLGVTDPDGDPVTITVTSIFQDEPVNTIGDGNAEPDGAGVGTSAAQVRAERSGSKKVPGDGRVYHIGFVADDDKGGECTGSVTVCVPHDQRPGHACIDGGPLYDSTMPSSKAGLGETPTAFVLAAYPNPFNPATTVSYALPEAARVRLVVYDVMGRAVARLVEGAVEAGRHEVVFDASSLPSGVYLVRLEAGAHVQTHALTLLK